MHKLYKYRRCIFLKDDKKINGIEKDEETEDVTKYGEFISSYFAWVSPERQKKRAQELNKMTKKEDSKK